MAMRAMLSTVLLFVPLLALPQTKKVANTSSTTLKLAPAFRAQAEDVLDCIDELAMLESAPEGSYSTQDVKCIDKMKKLRRAANTSPEKTMANLLDDAYGKVRTCRMGHQSACKRDETEARAVAIRAGNLRMN